ncbi:AAA family ATPase [Pseudomonas sp. HN2-3]|uniref:AAA family ATPase n=1 Tax=Pseudomonas sp. HN2-3 TaxID=2886360 RepID=UPI001D0FBA28|nr:AAA family ATPase [Pseudomonas sp. HN2-3]UDU80670.1 AAA family ATPase [Pseudomonas sp. HN2-3]
MKIEDIAKQLQELGENIVLIYAFNATGKTRLSVAYKNATKNPESNQHTGVYYNAFSEDLFVWDNDEGNGGANIHLTVLPSSLNRFHSFLYENPDAVMDKLAMYSPKFKFRLNSYEDPEKGIESVSFFVSDDESVPIKISRGEERIFVWCFFLALLEVDGWANTQDAHIFIDDPVSSLDEHNIYVTADTIIQQIDQYYLKKKIIVTTHHVGLFSILADRLKKGGKSERYKKLTKIFVLRNRGGEYILGAPGDSVFLFHLHLLKLLDEAGREQLYAHHVVMLRQALENISSFFGKGNIGYTLAQIGVEDHEDAANVINSLSHKDAYYYQSDLMSPAVEVIFRDVFTKLLDKYKFALHAG